MNVDRRTAVKSLSTLMLVGALGREYSGTIILAHGYNGSPDAGMYPELQSEAAAKLNLAMQVPDLPLSNREFSSGNPQKYMKPELASQNLAELLAEAKRPRFLIGHSLGANIALWTLSHFSVEVDGLLLISARSGTATADGELNKCYSRVLYPERIRRNIAGSFVALHAEDDSVVKPAAINLENIVQRFGAKPILLSKGEHFDKPEHAGLVIPIIHRELLKSVS